MRRLITRRVLSTALTVALALAASGAHAQAPQAFDVLSAAGRSSTAPARRRSPLTSASGATASPPSVRSGRPRRPG